MVWNFNFEKYRKYSTVVSLTSISSTGQVHSVRSKHIISN